MSKQFKREKLLSRPENRLFVRDMVTFWVICWAPKSPHAFVTEVELLQSSSSGLNVI